MTAMPIFLRCCVRSVTGARRLRVPLVFVVAALSACAVGPDYQRPQLAAPDAWSALHGGSPALLAASGAPVSPAEKNGWAVFNDATFDRLQQHAMHSSPDLQTAALRFVQSRVQRLTVAAQRGAQLDVRAGAGRQNQSQNGAGSRMIDALAPPGDRDSLIKTISQPYNIYQAGFDASWELDLWGRVRRSIEAADADVAAAAALLDDMRLSVASELARNYFELRGIQRQLRIARADIRASGAALQLIEARAAGGLTDDREAVRRRAQWEDLNARLPQLIDREAAAINRITLLMGEKPGALAAELAARDTDDEPPALPDLAPGVPSDVARRRPDIRAAAAKLHAATAGIGIATADLYPRITLGASFGYESLQSGDLADWRSRQWSVGPSLQLPLFDRGRRRATVTLRKLEQQQAAVAYHQTVLKAWHEVDDALSAYNAEQLRNRHLRDKLHSSERGYTLAKARYDGGLTDFVAALDARRDDLQARGELSDSDSRLRILLVALFKALGGQELETAAVPAG
jgi:NodT family efflux transporter outer membrane factor (OMF) lipoprotein